jgi:phi LC3 family holin
MRINWKLRLQNKTTLLALLTALVVFVYSVLSALGITPSITQEQAMNVVVALVALLGGLGIVVDPTTSGISDSAQAMKYEEPR